MIDELLKFNREFVKSKGYERFITNKYPDKKIAIVSCMDTRLTELLPAALGIKNGDVKIIKNAGAIISHPFGSVIRSLLVAIYELGVNEVMIVGHTDCGAKHMDSEQMIEVMKKRGIPSEHIDMMRYCGIDFKSWLRGFDTPEGSVRDRVFLEKIPFLWKRLSFLNKVTFRNLFRYTRWYQDLGPHSGVCVQLYAAARSQDRVCHQVDQPVRVPSG